jgi:hypothetical protein
MNVPPELPPLGSSVPKAAAGRSFRALATYSWASILLSVAVNLLMPGMAQSSHTREEVLGKAIVQALFAVTGLLAGIIALFGIPKYGRKGLLWPALCGTCVWLLLVALALPIFNAARQKALQVRASKAQQIQLTPVVHLPEAVRISDSKLGFSFELPPEYTPLPADKKPASYRYAYWKQVPGNAPSVVVVTTLNGTISPNDHLDPKSIPPGKAGSYTRFVWRGLEVDGFRVPETTPAGSYVTFQVQIPLKQQAIQIGFGGPGDDETTVRALAARVLSTLDGPLNR